jgi:hypothetical protein
MKTSVVQSVLLMLACAAPIAAQSRAIALGDRVKVFAPKAGYPRVIGTVAATTPDVLAVKQDRSMTEIPMPRFQIEELYLSTDSHSNVMKGTFIGAALFAGGAIWFGPRAPTRQAPGIESGRVSTQNVVVGAAVGAGFGALIGHFVRTDTWVRVSPSGP